MSSRTTLAVLLLAATLTGCATTSDPTPPASSTQEDDMTRPTMEEAVERYTEMQREVVTALQSDPGGLTWESDPEEGFSRSGCADGSPDAEAVYFPLLLAPGAYEGDDREKAAAVVREIGERYGFTEEDTVVDRPDELMIVGEDEWGGRYRFGIGKNATLAVNTGCHEWADDAAADALLDREPIIG